MQPELSINAGLPFVKVLLVMSCSAALYYIPLSFGKPQTMAVLPQFLIDFIYFSFRELFTHIVYYYQENLS